MLQYACQDYNSSHSGICSKLYAVNPLEFIRPILFILFVSGCKIEFAISQLKAFFQNPFYGDHTGLKHGEVIVMG